MRKREAFGKLFIKAPASSLLMVIVCQGMYFNDRKYFIIKSKLAQDRIGHSNPIPRRFIRELLRSAAGLPPVFFPILRACLARSKSRRSLPRGSIPRKLTAH